MKKIYKFYEKDSEIISTALSKMNCLTIKENIGYYHNEYSQLLVKELERRIDNETYICFNDKINLGRVLQNVNYSDKIKDYELESFKTK